MKKMSVTPEVEKLLRGKNFASFATLMKDGSPQVTPTWVDYKDEMILINTAEGRVKERNVNLDKRVALSVFDNSNPYNMVAIRGNVEEITTINANSHIDKLAKRYLNLEKYPYRNSEEKRVILKIKPQHIFHWKS